MAKIRQKCKVISGGIHQDQRGSVRFVNDFFFRGIKRFYQLSNLNTKIIRAFHGHMKEAKYAYVASGKILLYAVYLDNPKNPSKLQKMERFIISSEKPQIIYIPPQYANGFKTLKKNSTVIFFSTLSLSESLKDDYFFPYDYWGKHIWTKKNEAL